LQPHKKQVK
jgi:hypothetical protein